MTAALDADRIVLDGGVLLLADANKRLGEMDSFVAIILDHRDAGQTIGRYFLPQKCHQDARDQRFDQDCLTRINFPIPITC